MMAGVWPVLYGALLALQSPQPASHVLIIAGVGGAPEYQQAFYDEGLRMADAARTRYGVPDSAIVFLAEDPSRNPARIRGKSTRAEVERVFARVAKTARAGDLVFVLLIGHGSARDGHSRFNLPGPDMTAADFAALLEPLAAQRVAFVNSASASGEFLTALAGKNRAIVTATASPRERNETRFAAHFVDAYATDGADTDKDGRVSLLEAFVYAHREVAREYESSNQLETEHALLDDDGDGKGSGTPGARSGDGALASRLVLTAGTPAATVAATMPGDPRVAALLRHKDSVEARIAVLRRRKASMDSTAYERQLEALLVDLAVTNRKLKSDGGGTR